MKNLLMAMIGGILIGSLPMVFRSCGEPKLPPLPEEKKAEIMAQPPVELWGFQAQRLTNTEPERSIPYLLTPSDGGYRLAQPTDAVDDPSRPWHRYVIALSVWGRGDEARIWTLMDRWAEEGYRASTRDDLKR